MSNFLRAHGRFEIDTDSKMSQEFKLQKDI